MKLFGHLLGIIGLLLAASFWFVFSHYYDFTTDHVMACSMYLLAAIAASIAATCLSSRWWALSILAPLLCGLIYTAALNEWIA